MFTDLWKHCFEQGKEFVSFIGCPNKANSKAQQRVQKEFRHWTHLATKTIIHFHMLSCQHDFAQHFKSYQDFDV